MDEELDEGSLRKVESEVHSLQPDLVAKSLQELVNREIILFNKTKSDEEFSELILHNIAVLSHACARFQAQSEHEKELIESSKTKKSAES